MKILLLILLSATIAIQLQSQDKGEWENLLNGKDFKGWKQLNGKAKYEIQNGEIVGTTVANEPNSFMVTEKNYGDFILELEFKVPEGMNSGIQFRSLFKPEYMNSGVQQCFFQKYQDQGTLNQKTFTVFTQE